MHLDLFTLGIMGLAVGATISLSFTLLGMVLRGMPALPIWAAGFWVLTAAALAQGLDEKQSLLSAVVGSGLIALSNALMLMGIAVHVRYPLRWRWPMLLVAVFLVIQLVFVLEPPAQLFEALVFGAKSVVWDVWMIWVLLRRSPRDLRNTCAFTATIFCADMAFYFLRSAVMLAPGTESQVLLATQLVSANYLFGIVCTFLLSTGFTLMLAQRLTLDLRSMARTDGMTGLPNRRAVIDEGRRAVDACRVRGETSSVLLLDLDGFKVINDSWGHAAGDEVLQHFVRLMRGIHLPDGALLARYGGEEFLVVLPAIDAAQAIVVAEDMRACVAATPAQFGTHSIPVTTSVGVAGAAGLEFDALVSAADAALYRAKKLGRNRVEWVGSRDEVVSFA
ncbi:diguanylate cyclase (GGDEF) domain-containing protein [Dyella sp. OK004]|uniref:GGDEF domain-containing protein n=1 Tax=Dyella sp. OK004 TaxID=1855292 RepID=UPI0008EC8954|nr:GGDEF domain-containing protein [Dyella sp. OK004]SFR88214.1 diguanylate cyclase (GGDEF) domain-containing protein [Dyella sp. OK004]